MAQTQTGITQVIQSERKRLLIEATITAINEHGLSNLTLAKITGHVGMTAGTVSFHFDSKESLLLETLKFVAEEFEHEINLAIDNSDHDAGMRLCSLIEANLDARVSETRKVAVWYAFLSETRTRKDYQEICGDRDKAYYKKIRELCEQIVEEAGKQNLVSADILADGLAGMLDGFWSDILFSGDSFDRENAKQRCYLYLANVFPWRFPLDQQSFEKKNTEAPSNLEALAPQSSEQIIYTLPSWVYNNHAFFEQEKDLLFMSSWQLVCHVNDLPEVGSYVRYDMFNERAFVIRDKDDKIHAYQNVCSHRAHTIVQNQAGSCPGRLTCPYHGWTYSLDGKRIGISDSETFREHDKNQFGLKRLDLEIYLGFIFIRYRPEGPTVAECFAPVAKEFKAYRTEEMHAVDSKVYGGSQFWTEVIDIDWKNGLENYVEDYHFSMGHKGLSALMKPEYDREPLPNGVCRLSHEMHDAPRNNWSAERYRKLLPEFEHLPDNMQKRWTYYTLFPNTFFDMFPEQMDFMQMIPLAPGKMLLRSRSYALPDDSRTVNAVRYLSDRINSRVQNEDNVLCAEVQKGLHTSGYEYGILSDKEVLVKHFQDWIRKRVPVSRLLEPPQIGA